MSYRTFKHLLGETSLERKCRFIFGGGILLLVTISFYIYGRKTESLVIGQSRQAARMQVKPILEEIHLKAALVRPELAPIVDKVSRELTPKDGFQHFDWHVVKPFAEETERRPRDEFERRIVDRFLQAAIRQRGDWDANGLTRPYSFPDGTPAEYTEIGPDRSEYTYVQAVLFRPGCIASCHASPAADPVPAMVPIEMTRQGMEVPEAGLEPIVPPLDPIDDEPGLSYAAQYHDMIRLDESGKYARTQPGDLAGVVLVKLPMEQTNKAINRNRAILIATALVTAILAMFASWTIVRYIIVRPVKHLREVSDAIAAGRLNIRSRIQTGDEFEELSHAFNRMLHNLVAMQQELRDVNGDLDRKVDELAQANMALYEMNRIKSDFLATMSHELRTPLNSIIGFSEVLSGNEQLSEKQRRYASNIQNSGRMLLSMINDILDLAKIESGKMEVRSDDFSVREVCETLAVQMRPMAERKSIELECRLDEAIPLVRQDQGKLRQIVYNLLSNAIKFTPEGGRVVLSAKAEGRSIVVAVADNGIGIAAEDREVIFEKFRQAGIPGQSADVLIREHQGTGLGLSIVRELARMLGGDVSLDSEPGRGSTFTVVIPQQLPGDRRIEVALSDGTIDLSKARRIEHHPAAASTVGAPAPAPAAPDRRPRPDAFRARSGLRIDPGQNDS
ncbi:sensor histidine kinase [Tautonia marina]|uniref:sensor histidine kinase n=1 Tax=Tautonia marina TaxID=2653855 RepID=UPI001F315E67|nr:ATP-binding protein [Tautonia marina]